MNKCFKITLLPQCYSIHLFDVFVDAMLFNENSVTYKPCRKGKRETVLIFTPPRAA